MNKLKVTRTIVIEGDPDWVRATLERSWLQPGAPRVVGNGGRQEETSRVEEAFEGTVTVTKWEVGR